MSYRRSQPFSFASVECGGDVPLGRLDKGLSGACVRRWRGGDVADKGILEPPLSEVCWMVCQVIKD